MPFITHMVDQLPGSRTVACQQPSLRFISPQTVLQRSRNQEHRVQPEQNGELGLYGDVPCFTHCQVLSEKLYRERS